MIGCQKLALAYWNHKQNAEQEVFKLVSQIINMLEVHHQNYATTSPGGTQESYLAINHIRDNLIAPKDRKKLSNLWERAVKFLDENESRYIDFWSTSIIASFIRIYLWITYI